MSRPSNSRVSVAASPEERQRLHVPPPRGVIDSTTSSATAPIPHDDDHPPLLFSSSSSHHNHNHRHHDDVSPLQLPSPAEINIRWLLLTIGSIFLDSILLVIATTDLEVSLTSVKVRSHATTIAAAVSATCSMLFALIIPRVLDSSHLAATRRMAFVIARGIVLVHVVGLSLSPGGAWGHVVLLMLVSPSASPFPRPRSFLTRLVNEFSVLLLVVTVSFVGGVLRDRGAFSFSEPAWWFAPIHFAFCAIPATSIVFCSARTIAEVADVTDWMEMSSRSMNVAVRPEDDVDESPSAPRTPLDIPQVRISSISSSGVGSDIEMAGGSAEGPTDTPTVMLVSTPRQSSLRTPQPQPMKRPVGPAVESSHSAPLPPPIITNNGGAIARRTSLDAIIEFPHRSPRHRRPSMPLQPPSPASTAVPSPTDPNLRNNSSDVGERSTSTLDLATPKRTLQQQRRDQWRSVGTSVTTVCWKKGTEIGRGAYGVVNIALNEFSGELMAVKHIQFNTGDDHLPRRLEALQSELAMLRMLEHDNIVKYYFTERTKDADGVLGVNIFLEYVPGGSILQVLQQFGPLSEVVVASYMEQILLALDYLHSNGVVHRDVKAANVLLTTCGSCKLADFGAAAQLDHLARDPHKSRECAGTPLWMAPEVILEQGSDWRADIWSLGCTMLEFLTGKPPFAHVGRGTNNTMATLDHILTNCADFDALLRFDKLKVPLSCACIDFLRCCLQKDPAARRSCSGLLQHPFIVYGGMDMLVWGEDEVSDNAIPQSLSDLRRASSGDTTTNSSSQQQPTSSSVFGVASAGTVGSSSSQHLQPQPSNSNPATTSGSGSGSSGARSGQSLPLYFRGKSALRPAPLMSCSSSLSALSNAVSGNNLVHSSSLPPEMEERWRSDVTRREAHARDSVQRSPATSESNVVVATPMLDSVSK
eukprot:PhM_4_TR13304/c0_g1_i5/m.77144